MFKDSKNLIHESFKREILISRNEVSINTNSDKLFQEKVIDYFFSKTSYNGINLDDLRTNFGVDHSLALYFLSWKALYKFSTSLILIAYQACVELDVIFDTISTIYFSSYSALSDSTMRRSQWISLFSVPQKTSNFEFLQ